MLTVTDRPVTEGAAATGEVSPEALLRRCVHCGFCLATCPTYRLLGEENDSPRGRLDLMAQFLDGGPSGPEALRHLDRCLECRACETTCPSGVAYHRVLAQVRPRLAVRHPRPLHRRLLRCLLGRLLPWPERTAALLDLAGHFAFLLPGGLRRRLPPRRLLPRRPPPAAPDLLVLGGCIQSVTHPQTNRDLATLLAAGGWSLEELEHPACCGALNAHLDQRPLAEDHMKAWIRTWEQRSRAVGRPLGILAVASGCALHLREYGDYFATDPAWGPRARAFAAAVRDPAELVTPDQVRGLARHSPWRRLVFHVPCTLAHGLGTGERVRALLEAAGFTLLPDPDPWRCCGAAGAWSLLHPRLARRLLEARLARLPLAEADAIVTANLGCQLQLASGTDLPVVHWVELLGAAQARGAAQEMSAGRRSR